MGAAREGAAFDRTEGRLAGERSTRPAPSLERGRFTPIALAEDDAVHLFADGHEGPVIHAGVLQASPAGLAVVESQPMADRR